MARLAWEELCWLVAPLARGATASDTEVALRHKTLVVGKFDVPAPCLPLMETEALVVWQPLGWIKDLSASLVPRLVTPPDEAACPSRD